MTKKIIASFALFFIITTISTYSQEEKKDSIAKIKITDIYGQICANPYYGKQGTLEDFKKLAPSSLLLSNNFNGFSPDYIGYFSYDRIISVMAAIKNPHRKNVQPRIGLGYYEGNNLLYGLSKMKDLPNDTLISNQTGDTTIIRRTEEELYSMAYTSKQFRIDLSLIFRTNPETRISLYGGLGANTGVSFNTKTYIRYMKVTNESSYSNNSSSYYSGQPGDLRSEKFTNKNSFTSSIYAPLGIDFRIGNRKEWLKRIHVYCEARPSITSMNIPELRKITYTRIPINLGVKVSL